MPVPEPIDRLGPLALRCPDPAVEVLHPDFLKLRLFSASVERLAGGTPIHASPLEHQGVAMEHPRRRSRNFVGWWQFRELFEERGEA